MAEEFPINTFLQAYQTKYANEQAANPNIGQTFVESMTKGSDLATTAWTQERLKAKERAFEGFKDYTKNGEWYYGNDPEKKLSFEDISQIYDMVGKGDLKFKTDQNGVLSLANSKGVPLGISWKKMEMPIYEKDPVTGEYRPVAIVPKNSKITKGNTVTYNRIQNPDGTYIYENPNTGEKSGTIPKGAEWKNVTLQVAPGDKPLSTESAGKLAMLQQGVQDIDKASKIIFSDKGINEDALLGANMPFGGAGEQGKQLYSYLYNAMEGKIRVESGAAVPDSEVRRLVNRFMPKPSIYGPFADTEKTAKDKLSRLKDFLQNAQVSIDPQGKYTAKFQNSTIPLEDIGKEYESGKQDTVKDKYGFSVGETKLIGGKTYKYMGNNQWQ